MPPLPSPNCRHLPTLLALWGGLSIGSFTQAEDFTVSYNPGDSVVLELSNIDDYINVTGPGVSSTNITSPQSIDFTNTIGDSGGDINVQLYNAPSSGGYTYTWELLVDGVVAATAGCGVRNSVGCDGNASTSGLVKDDTISLIPDTDGDGPKTSRWKDSRAARAVGLPHDVPAARSYP